MDCEKIARVPTFITVPTPTKRYRPNSAKKPRKTNESPKVITSTDALNNDIEDFIKILLNRVLNQLAEARTPRLLEEEDETHFRSPIEARSVEKADVFYTPRSEGGRVNTPSRIEIDDFDDTGSLEFALKDIPIQEDPESPVKYNLSAQLLAEIDETLNSILNLDENSDDVRVAEDGEDHVDEVNSSILIEYSDNPLEQIIADYADYFKEREVSESLDALKEGTVEKADPNSMNTLTEEIEDSFNALLGMSEKEGGNISFGSPLGHSALSNCASEDVFLRAGLSDLEDVPGTDLHRSFKTPDATQEAEKAELNPTASSISTDDEDGAKGFIILNDAEIKESFQHYEKFKERLINEKKSGQLEDVQPVVPVVVEMENKAPEASKSVEDAPFRSRSPVRKRSRASTFFRRAASVLGLFKTRRSWSPREDIGRAGAGEDDSYHVARDDENIEVITTSFSGDPPTIEITKYGTLPRTKEKLSSVSEITETAESKEREQVRPPTRFQNRRFLSRLTGTHSLPRSSGRAWSFFKIHKANAF